jgi:hypothetical protein
MARGLRRWGGMRWSSVALACLVAAGCGSVTPLKPEGGAGGSGAELTGRGKLFDVCSEDTDCSAGLSCTCGICTKPCTASNECAAPATCPALSPIMYDCQNLSTAGCLIRCTADADCKTVGPTALCTGGLCRRPTLITIVDGGVLTCAERTAQISSEVRATLTPVIANADRSCTVDADCTRVGTGTSCYLGGCGGVDVSMSGAAAIASTLKAIEKQYCGAFWEAGCAFSGGIIHCPAEGFPTCVAGQCQDSLRIIPSDAGSSQ